MAFSSSLLLVLCTTAALAFQTETTWGSVVFTYHGEKTPSLASGPHHFTPHGAIQVQNAGQIIRERYIERRNTTNSIPHFYPINGISPTEIDNSQLNILTLDDEIMTGSALAFTQGLYPPRASNSTAEENRFVKGYNNLGSLEYYPLDGYQYPAIRTVNTALDFDSIWLAGHTSCDQYSVSQVAHQNTSSYINRVQSTYKFYQGLRSTVLEYVNTDAGQVDFRKAEELYEYALYESLHNSTHGGPYAKFRPNQLGQLLALASEQQFEMHSGNISSIAGQTLAGKVITQLNLLMLNSGSTDKLSLMFTSFEPFLSFFALSGLSAGPSASKFRSLPNHGSIMAFELFSYTEVSNNNNVAKIFPSQADLYVRFLFRNGSEDTLTAYPLFGNSPSNTDLRWYDFVRSMEEFEIRDVNDWCNSCATQNVFCRQLQNLSLASGQLGTDSHGLSPVVSGVIGALVALALAVLAFVALALLGFRLQRTDPKTKGSKSDLGVLRTSSGTGGYKGAEKLASDTDLRLRGGAGATVVRHERVGSWELKDGPQPQSPPPIYPSLDKDLESGRVRSYVDYNRRNQEYEDLERVDPFGDPVKPADQI